MKIYLDADSCPREAREMILRFSSRLKLHTIFAANRLIPNLPADVQMELCPPGDDSADNRIVELAEKGDLVITRDLPLAERLSEKNVMAMDDRGRVFTKENIRQLRSLRDFTVDLANSGLEYDRMPSYGKKELKSFADSLDRELNRLLKTAGN